MHLPRPIEIAITMLLVAATPWCCCVLGLSACCGNAGPDVVATSDQAESVDGCCHECCEEATEDAPHAPCRLPGKDCGSACCGPKISPERVAFDLPIDLVGSSLPAILPPLDWAVVAEHVPLPHPIDWCRPPGERAGRDVLRAHCVLLS